MAAAFGGVTGDASLLEMASDRLATLDASHSHQHVVETAAIIVACTAACNVPGTAEGFDRVGRLLLRALHTSPTSTRLWAMLTRLHVRSMASIPTLGAALARASTTAACTAAVAPRADDVYSVLAALLKASSDWRLGGISERECKQLSTRAVCRYLHTHPHLQYAWRLLTAVQSSR